MSRMQRLSFAVLPILFAALASPAFADDWKDENGHGRGKRGKREYKEEYWDGHCKVKRKLDKNGEYEEERKCKGHAPHAHGHSEVLVPGPAIVIDPAIRVHGTVILRP